MEADDTTRHLYARSASARSEISSARSFLSLPRRSQTAFAVVVSVGLVVASAVATPFANMPLQPIPGYMTAFGTAMVVVNFLLATLLYNRGVAERNGDLIRLATAYLFVAVIFVPLLLSFRDGFVSGSIIGSSGSSVWLWCFWHLGFVVSIGWYALRAKRNRPAWPISAYIAVVGAVVTAMTLLACNGLSLLPPVVPNGRTFFAAPYTLLPYSIVLINIGSLGLCLRHARASTTDLWLSVGMVAACFDLWLTLQGTDRFALGWYVAKCGSLFTSLTVLSSQLYDITRLFQVLARANDGLQLQATRDGLTGLYNRRYFDEVIAFEWAKANREGTSLSLLLVDVDWFKQFNDRYGHPAGDECLRAVGLAFRHLVRRPADIVARYGGEEFVVVLPETDSVGARHLAERMRRSIVALDIPHAPSDTGVLTISIGCATTRHPGVTSLKSLVEEADRALYVAKERGRNRVCTVDEIVADDLPDLGPRTRQTSGLHPAA